MKRSTPVKVVYDIPARPDEILFAQEYIKDCDAINSIKRMKLVTVRAQKRTLEEIAKDYLNNVNVQREIQKALQDRIKRIQVTEDSVIAQIARIAYADPKDLYDDEGNIRRVEDIPYDLRICISKLKTKSLFSRQDGSLRKIGTVTEIQLSNQLEALKTLLEKVILKPENPLRLTDNRKVINNYNIKELNKEEVSLLLKLKGYQQTKLGYKNDTNDTDNQEEY